MFGALLRAFSLPGWFGWALIVPALALRLEGWRRGSDWRDDVAGGLLFWALAFSFLGHIHPMMPIGAACVMAPFWVFEGWMARRLASRVAFPFCGVLAIATSEWLRTFFPMGGVPTAGLGLGAAQSFFLPIGSIFGEAGVGLLILFVAGFFVCLVHKDREAKILVAPLLAAVVLVCFIPDPAESEELSISCLAVQANLSLEEKHGALSASDVFARHAELTADGLADYPNTELIIWAETMWPWPAVNPADAGLMRRPWPGRPVEEVPIAQLSDIQSAQVSALLEGYPKARLLVGAHFYRGVPEESPEELMSLRTSEVVLFEADGGLVDQSGKQELVPFGESLPFGGKFPGAKSLGMKIFSASGLLPDFHRPPYTGPLATGSSPQLLGTAVCWENMFPEVFRRQVVDGAQAFVIQSNEAWYGVGAEMDQMLASTQWRAVETGRQILRVTNTGISGLVDVTGHVSSALPRGEKGVMSVDLNYCSVGAPLTAFALWGWLLMPAVALFGLVLVCFPRQNSS